jgi:hypothetical protein
MAIRIQFILISFMFYFSGFAQQFSSIKLSSSQLTEIQILAAKTKSLNAGLKEQEKVKSELLELANLTLSEIAFVLNVIDPNEAQKAQLTQEELKWVNDFAHQFYINRIDDFSPLFKKNGIVKEDVAAQNFKQLLVTETKIILGKTTIQLDGKSYTKEGLLSMINKDNFYDIFFKILNQNVDDKVWDVKSNFVFKNGDLKLFK